MASSIIAESDLGGAARRHSERGRRADSRPATSAPRLPRASDSLARGGSAADVGGGVGGSEKGPARRDVTRRHGRPPADATETRLGRGAGDRHKTERKNDTDRVATAATAASNGGATTDPAWYAATGDRMDSAVSHRAATVRRRSDPVLLRRVVAGPTTTPTDVATERRRHRHQNPIASLRNHVDDVAAAADEREEKIVAHQTAAAVETFVPVTVLSGCAYRLHSLSASGCGLHVLYHTGAFAGLRERRVYAHRVYATSAGMTAALFYLLGLERYISLDELLAIIPVDSRHPQCRSTTRAFLKGLFTGGGGGRCATTPLHEARTRMIALITRLLRTHVPDAHRRVSGRLFTTVCRWPAMVAEVVGDYPTLDFLLLMLDITTNIPSVTSYGPTRWAGERWVDGGFVDCHPVEDARTVCITTQPFSQPSAPSWYYKRGRWGEISRAVDSRSAHVVYPLAHYRETFCHGKADALQFVDRHLAPEVACQRAADHDHGGGGGNGAACH